MKRTKALIAALLACLLLVPMLAVGSYADPQSDFEDNWRCFAAKYSSTTDKIIAPKGVVKTEGYTFTANDDGTVSVVTPDYDTFPGIFGTSLIFSKNKTALDNLTLTVKPDSFNYMYDGSGLGAIMSFIWSEADITEICNADANPQTGLDWGNEVFTNGLRHLLPDGSKGLVVNVSGVFWSKQAGTIASGVSVIYYDGSTIPDTDGRPGFRWSFIARNHPDTDLADDSDIERGHEKIDISEGLTFAFTPDTTLGYIVSVNGKQFYKGSEVGFFPNQSEWQTEKKDIDLSALVGLEGYVGAGAIDNSDQENTDCNYTVCSINGVPAAEWQGEENTHTHSESEWIPTIAANCVDTGIEVIKCTECGAILQHRETELDADAHTSSGVWVVTKAATATEVGVETCFCKYHPQAAVDTRDCYYNPFSDIPADSWYTRAALWCNHNDYMNGTSDTAFAPTTPVTRAMIVLILAKIDGVDLTTINSANPFADVPADKWFTKAVLWAASNGITKGTSDTAFSPNTAVTREQLATFFLAYSKYKGEDTTGAADLSGYTDQGEISAWALTAVKWAVAEGLISGTSTTTISPKTTATRAQVAVILLAYCS